MGLVGRAVTAARSAASMTLSLHRSTKQLGPSLHYAFRAVTTRDRAVQLCWRGMPFVARGTDWAALQEVVIENEYGALSPYLKNEGNCVVVDIGANIGTFALFVFSVAPNAIVHSFEPSARTFDLLDINRKRNASCNWTVHRAAGWSEDGLVKFANAAASTAGRVSTEGGETVPTLSLASILERVGGYADVAKIDIEGAEEALVAGRASELARIKTLVIELHPDYCDTARVLDAIRDAFGMVYAIPGRRSSKPLLLATNSARRLDLPTIPR